MAIIKQHDLPVQSLRLPIQVMGQLLLFLIVRW